jgi:hypothetical protein
MKFSNQNVLFTRGLLAACPLSLKDMSKRDNIYPINSTVHINQLEEEW